MSMARPYQWLEVDPEAVLYDNRGQFVVEPGRIDVYAGSSSKAGLKQSFTVKG